MWQPSQALIDLLKDHGLMNNRMWVDPNPGGDKAHVHVIGAPGRILTPDERVCSSMDHGETVVFHPKAIETGTSGRAFCIDCGQHNGERA